LAINGLMEYASFHYLMHKVPDAVKPVYVTGPQPLAFDELYSPRSSKVLITKVEKSYWRTRERIEYAFWEDRPHKLVVITCRNIETNLSFRTIFVDAEKAYFEVEAKARGDRDKIVKKKDKKLADDGSLHKAVVDFLLARLNIKQEECLWPDFAPQMAAACSSEVAAITTAVVDTSATTTATQETLAIGVPTDQGPRERMCVLDKLANDACDCIEVNAPSGYSIDGIDFVNLQPTCSIMETSSSSAAVGALTAAPQPVATVVDGSKNLPVAGSALAVPGASVQAAESLPVQINVKVKPSNSKQAAKPHASDNKKKIAPVN
jgi:hypothetical protein